MAAGRIHLYRRICLSTSSRLPSSLQAREPAQASIGFNGQADSMKYALDLRIPDAAKRVTSTRWEMQSCG